jgi:uncharacterized protein (TIGR00251 family)
VVDWLRTSDDAIVLSVHAQPGAKRSEIAGLHGDALKIRLAAPAVDGKANAALLAFLAGQLNLPRAAISLESGHNARHKILRIKGAPADSRQRLLATLTTDRKIKP